MHYFRAVLFCISFILPLSSHAQEQIAEVTKDEVLTIQPYDKVLGTPDAPVTVFEYASLSCSHCADFHLKVLPKIKEEYVDTGKVRVVLRDFPLNEPALRASVLTHCAETDELFFKLTNAAFRTQTSWAGQKNYLEILGNIGKLGGVSGEQFDACLKDETLETRILTSKLNAAKHLNIQSTPSIIIDGITHGGALSYEFYQKEFDKALDKHLKKSDIE
jgi:protein-disulfide isomerase